MIDFKDKIIVITGGGEGIGHAMAHILNNSGAIVIINDINEQGLIKSKEAFKEISGQCVFYQADIADRENVSAFSKFIKRKFGRIDILINNAGVSIGRLNAENISRDVWDWIFGVNFWGAVNCVDHFLPLLQTQTGAKIVNICSISSYFGMYQRSAYCASKSALKVYSAALRYELKEKGISVISVFPGMVNTKIFQHSKFWNSDKEKVVAEKLYNKYSSLSAEKAAQRIIAGIHKNRKIIHIGRDAKLISYLLRLFPKLGEDILNFLIIRSEARYRKNIDMAS